MRKGKITLNGTTVIISACTLLYIHSSSTKTGLPTSHPSLNSSLQTDETNLRYVEEVTTLLLQKDGLLEKMEHQLKAKGYEFQRLLAVYSKDDIRVKYILSNQEATESL
ncbi:hypothetical protein [Sporosarcina sp. Te-1]|uniref:hypothetical protein n=1 Tax=Sporosarcina sp. Te-1 TaxID=2818390 RepID=UPI001A9E6D78|nr:hypothetical protein [Sporosarcina sp. Te-1]QTD42108.1 hypothetical protein J3U78_04560 [Sporosarcina sp. Te-1]